MIRELEGNGSFDSPECLKYLEEADIVVTNPPFSKFRDFVKIFVGQGKDFLVVGNMGAITYKEVFPLFKENKLWLGMNHIKEFVQPNGEVKKFGNICWYTNIPNNAAKKPLILTKTFSPDKYPKYDNYDAIEVSRIKDIPMDYEGIMGVPITILEHYNPKQFEIIGHEHDLLGDGGSEHIGQFEVNGKGTYKRILINPKQFEIIGMAEDNGHGFSGEAKLDGLNPHAVIGGKNMYKRIFIRRKYVED